MAIKITTVDEAVEDNGIKILVHAPAGSGKTVLAATAGVKTLIISAESGLLSLKNKALKASDDHFRPDLCDVVEIQNIDDLEEVYEMLEDQADDRQYEWVALDSITEIAEQVLSAELEESKDPRKAYGNLQIRVNAVLRMFRDLPGYNIYMSAKQTPVKDDYSGLTIYSPMMPGAKLGNAIPYLFDEVLCLRIMQDDDGEDYRALQCARDVQYEAKDRSGALSKWERPSLLSISNKIHGIVTEEVEESSEAEEPIIVEDIKLKRTEYFHSPKSGMFYIVETVSEKAKVDELGCVKTTKAKYEKFIKEQTEEPESEPEESAHDDTATEETVLPEKLEKPEYYLHSESDSVVECLYESDVQDCIDQGCDKTTKLKYNKYVRALKAEEAEKELAEETGESSEDEEEQAKPAETSEESDDAEKEKFKEALKEMDHSDLANLALALDAEIETEVAFEAGDEELIDWIVESSMDDIKEAAKEIGLA